jgi:hypothetical protein
MTTNSSINNLIGTFSQVTIGSTANDEPEKFICIDTSTNRIGINTLEPQCSIDISGTSQDDCIQTNDLIINGTIIGKIISNARYTINISNIVVYTGTTQPGNLISGDIYRDVSGYLKIVF